MSIQGSRLGPQGRERATEQQLPLFEGYPLIYRAPAPHPNGLLTLVHAVHLVVVSLILFGFFYINWSNLSDALVHLDHLQMYGVGIAVPLGVWSGSHLVRAAFDVLRTRD